MLVGLVVVALAASLPLGAPESALKASCGERDGQELECVQVDLNHTVMDTLTCLNTTAADLCYRDCPAKNAAGSLVQYEGIIDIRSPTYVRS